MRHTERMTTHMPEWRATDTESPHETREVDPAAVLAYLRLRNPLAREDDPAHEARRDAMWRRALPDDEAPDDEAPADASES